MCGIAGFVGRGEKRDLEEMVGAIRHRGPDASGNAFAQGVGLGHARLSIIDTSSAGTQPMFTDTGRVAIIFNGEIYNFKDLKKDLGEFASKFKSNTDTEVILYLYKKYGEKCFSVLSGMFAIALYDFEKRELFLARDSLGKKPLYWCIAGGDLIFASEIKAILKHPSFSPELDSESLYKYLTYDFVPTPHSILKGVYKLEAGTYLSFKEGVVRKIPFWQPNFKEIDLTLKDAEMKLDSLIREATEKRLISDVPLGVFLSGGLDSSTVAYYASRSKKDLLKTFSIGFEDKSFDESSYAEKVASFLGTAHTTLQVTAREIFEDIPKIFKSLDEPLSDASIIPTYILSKLTKKHVTVALGGDGGDELFAGYPTFQAEKIFSFFSALPRALRLSFARAVNLIPVSHKNLSFDFKLKKFMEGAEESNLFYRHQKWLGTFSDKEKESLLLEEPSPDMNTFHDIERILESSSFSDDRNKNLFLYQRTYMMDEVLTKVDRASMLSGLEVRAPFLDKDVVEFVNSLPYQYKIKGFTTKYILKKLMKGRLPDEIIHRKKKGFGIPLSAWLSGPLKGLLLELLSKERIRAAGIFNPHEVERLKREHLEGKRDNRKKLWNILCFEMWRENFLK